MPHARCSRCRARRTLARHPDQYQRVPRCPKCGNQGWTLDDYRRRVERAKGRTCTPGRGGCNGYHYPHRRGSRDCFHNPNPPPDPDMNINREAFLRWFQERYPDEVTLTCREAFNLDDDRFIGPKCATAWAAWQAGAAAQAPLNQDTAMGKTPPPPGNNPFRTTHRHIPPAPTSDTKVRFNFGKYRQEVIDEILIKDPQYILWAHTNVANHGGVTEEQRQRAERMVDSKPAKPAKHVPFEPDDFADDDIPF